MGYVNSWGRFRGAAQPLIPLLHLCFYSIVLMSPSQRIRAGNDSGETRRPGLGVWNGFSDSLLVCQLNRLLKWTDRGAIRPLLGGAWMQGSTTPAVVDGFRVGRWLEGGWGFDWRRRFPCKGPAGRWWIWLVTLSVEELGDSYSGMAVPAIEQWDGCESEVKICQYQGHGEVAMPVGFLWFRPARNQSWEEIHDRLHSRGVGPDLGSKWIEELRIDATRCWYEEMVHLWLMLHGFHWLVLCWSPIFKSVRLFRSGCIWRESSRWRGGETYAAMAETSGLGRGDADKRCDDEVERRWSLAGASQSLNRSGNLTPCIFHGALTWAGLKGCWRIHRGLWLRIRMRCLHCGEMSARSMVNGGWARRWGFLVCVERESSDRPAQMPGSGWLFGSSGKGWIENERPGKLEGFSWSFSVFLSRGLFLGEEKWRLEGEKIIFRVSFMLYLFVRLAWF